jgi:hypothetical protein
MNEEIIKRIRFLEQLVADKRAFLEVEMRNLETLCVELVSLHDKLGNEEQDNRQ